MSQIIYWTRYQADARLPFWNGAGAPGFLSLAEQLRLEGMRFPKRRREWLLGRWVMKKLLQACHPACAGLELAAIPIQSEPGGAPYLAINDPTARQGTISISHREDAAACAYAPSLVAGLDLEVVEPRSDAFVRDFFTPAEAARAFALSGPERDRYTALVWSAKEAVLKALRTGLRVDTRSIELAEHGQPDENGWGDLRLVADLQESRPVHGWWRVEGTRVITLAALGTGEDVELKYVAVRDL